MSIRKIKGLNTVNKWLYILLVFVIIIDPTNTIFRLKDLLFILFMCTIFWNPPTINKKILLVLCIFLFVIIYGFLIPQLIPLRIDREYFTSFFKSSLFILVLFPLLNFNSENLLRVPVKVSIFIPIIVIGIYISFLISPELTGKIYTFFSEKNNTVIISMRTYLGITLIALFYKTIPICFFSLTYYLRNSHNKKNKLLAILFFAAILLSGSRTPILCGFAILLAILFTSDFSKNRYFKVVVSTTFLIGLCVMIFLLVNEKGEPSRDVKITTVNDYMQVYSDNRTFFTGTGVGSFFYSTGRHDYIAHTELTYFELIRMFGLFMGCIIILLAFLPALGYFITKNRMYKDFFIAYFFYMIMAGTNPLLFSSTGMYILSLGLILFIRTLDERKNISYSISHL